MKKNKKHIHHTSAAYRVCLEFTNPVAKTVYLAGTFNDWRPASTPMISLQEGRWIKELALPPGRYEYLVVADGEWLSDPLAPETSPNPFGGVNSVLHVPAG
ncbi:MAG: glycogen-binding domain-containing protein [Verrucomicrobiota bacterium]